MTRRRRHASLTIAVCAALVLVDLTARSIAQQQGPREIRIPSDERPRPRAGNAVEPQLLQALALIHVKEARKTFSVSGQGLAVAVLDTGLLTSHVDFHGRVGLTHNFTTDYGGDATNVTDGQGHGTNVAGIIAARKLARRPSDPVGEHEGVAPDATLVPLKVVTNGGHGDFGWVEAALQWVLDNARDPSVAPTTEAEKKKLPITVVNVSLSDQQHYERAEDVPDYIMLQTGKKILALRDRNIAVVVAAGNEFFTHGSRQGMGWPAIIAETISVGAFYDADIGARHYDSGAFARETAARQIAPFSQRFHASVGGTFRTDIFAPGSLITSSGWQNDRASSDQQGTSQAAPVVAGMVLLMQQYHVAKTGKLPTVAQLEGWLREGSAQDEERDTYGDKDNVDNTGLTFMRLDAVTALTAVQRALSPP